MCKREEAGDNCSAGCVSDLPCCDRAKTQSCRDTCRSALQSTMSEHEIIDQMIVDCGSPDLRVSAHVMSVFQFFCLHSSVFLFLCLLPSVFLSLCLCSSVFLFLCHCSSVFLILCLCSSVFFDFAHLSFCSFVLVHSPISYFVRMSRALTVLSFSYSNKPYGVLTLHGWY